LGAYIHEKEPEQLRHYVDKAMGLQNVESRVRFPGKGTEVSEKISLHLSCYASMPRLEKMSDL